MAAEIGTCYLGAFLLQAFGLALLLDLVGPAGQIFRQRA